MDQFIKSRKNAPIRREHIYYAYCNLNDLYQFYIEDKR